jgi:hypothetical protein
MLIGILTSQGVLAHCLPSLKEANQRPLGAIGTR